MRETSRGEYGVGIGAACRLTGVEIHTLRYWEREFSAFLHPGRTRGGQRRYRDEDIRAILKLRELLHDKMYSIPGARKHLESLSEAA